ncbi:hypothetical protein GQE99_14185 [Maritimibacter sp. DP07]|jgi:hypothetical protein|uniref:Uncharacterized protein n=1 Tax=Maritimibacter harenae TaxID=2606218 RepID=A0A845M6K7_9RHOB|nr:hypothetical protein [Maritimibacter harenae]MZR14168.1 hypothetical protein [Maritimibacter harenae]
MSTELPEYYFRVRENGAFVFKVDTQNRHRRIEMDQIAVVNTRTGEIKPNGERTLSNQDMAAISDWLDERQELLDARQIDDILRTVDSLNHTANWVQKDAEDHQLDMVTDSLLMAMHDLRTLLVRKKAERMMREE